MIEWKKSDIITSDIRHFMDLLKKFQQFIHAENLFSPQDKLLLAVSGGIDSVVLCQLCKEAGYAFVVAHANFQLRGAESVRDEQFVGGLGTMYNVPVLVKRFETAQYTAEHKVSIQVAARELRYAWFEEIINDPLTADSRLTTDDSRLPSPDPELPTQILTAHHLDDNIETMLMNFFKGTGIAGLRGMLPKQGRIVRPLLFATKEEIKQFAMAAGLSWVEDSSNQSDKYARNYLRNQFLPLVKNLYPEADQNLARNLQRFRDIETLYHQSIELHKKKLLEHKGNEVHIPVLKLAKTVPLASVVYEIIKPYGFGADQASAVVGLLSSETGRYIQSATHRILRNRNWLIIAPLQTKEADLILIEEPGTVEFAIGRLQLSILPNSQFPIPDSQHLALLDAKEIAFPLLLRKWKAGDYFYPLGMRKKKKLSRFFIDQKLSKIQKENTWVLEANKKVIWVVGRRIDNRYKITPQTTHVLQLTLKTLQV